MKVADLIKQLLSESAVYGFSSVLSRFAQVLLMPLYTRFLTPGDYGVMAIVTTASTVAGIIVTFQLNSSAFRWFLDTEDEDDRKTTMSSWAWCQLVSSAFLVGLVYFYDTAFGISIQNDQETIAVGTYLLLALSTVFFSTFELVFLSLLRIQRRKWQTLVVTLFGLALTVAITIILVVVFEMGLYGIYLAALLASIIKAGFYSIFLANWILPRYFRYQRLKEMLKYSLPFIPAGLSLWVIGLIDRFFLIKYTNSYETGLYQLSNTIASVLTVITTGFLQAWSPFAFSISDLPNAKETYASVLEIFLIITCVLTIAVSYFSPEILYFLATPTFYQSYDTVGILCLSNSLLGVYQIVAIGLALRKKTTPIFYATLFASIFNVAANFVLIPMYGRHGAAWVTLLSTLIIPIYLFPIAQRNYFIPYRLVKVAFIFVATLFLLQIDGLFGEIGIRSAVMKIGSIAVFIVCLFFLSKPFSRPESV